MTIVDLKSPNEESSNRTLSPGKGGRSLRKEMISYFILYHMLFLQVKNLKGYI